MQFIDSEDLESMRKSYSAAELSYDNDIIAHYAKETVPRLFSEVDHLREFSSNLHKSWEVLNEKLKSLQSDVHDLESKNSELEAKNSRLESKNS